MKCALCDNDGRMHLTVGGDEYGPACDGHCIDMWNTYLDYVSGIPPVTMNSPAERELNKIIRDRGWVAEAKEAEERARGMSISQLVDEMEKMGKS